MPFAKRVLSTVEGLAPIAVLFSVFVYGVLLLLAAFAAHLDVFTNPGDSRLFGYVREINWGLNYVLPIPVALFFSTATINSITSTIGALARARMIVTETGSVIDEDALLESWQRYGSHGVLAASLLSIIGLLVSGYEWVTACLVPALYHRTYHLLPGWNIAWNSMERSASAISCAIFGFFAFAAQAAVVAALLLFATLVVAFAVWIFDYTKNSTKAELYPNPRSKDDRRGFENFESFIENLLLAAVTFFFVFFMTRLDALYVYSDSPSISSFIAQNIFLKGFTSALREKGAGWLFDLGNVADASTTLVAAGFCLVAILGFLVPSIIVRQAAKRSQQRFLNRLEEAPTALASVHEMTPTQAKSAVKKMVFWPLHYPKFQLLLVFVTFAAICFACYRLTLTILLMLLIQVVRKALSAMGLVRRTGTRVANENGQG
jgi:hypothetical protein